MDRSVRQYMVVTFNYWNFTLTDGALRMLVVLYFHQLGYDTLAIASLFLFYEFFGVVTNLLGGWLGARLGLNRTMNVGLAIQIIALMMMAVPSSWLSVLWVMFAQALSGIAKDLNKMSAKSSIKGLVASGQQGTLYKWIAILTGSKNALKGVGFFLGGVLLSTIGFQYSMFVMSGMLLLVFFGSIFWLDNELGKAKYKPKFQDIFSKSRSVNVLSAARLFLFGARDIWFVVALPVYLGTVFDWNYYWVGGFMATWVVGYGFVQACAPKITGRKSGLIPNSRSVTYWVAILVLIMVMITLAVQYQWHPQLVIIIGLFAFGAAFAVNSSLHSYLIVSYAKEDGASLDVGFYYMANAMGRLIGTVLSGWLFQMAGFVSCLWVSAAFLVCSMLISLKLPHKKHGN